VLAGNEMLNELIGVFITRLRWLFGQYDELVGMAQEHEAIYAAVAARDAELLRELVPLHLAAGRDLAERRLRELRSQSVV
jgi:DNA-binding GntR family transcriptional regulator